MMSLLRVAGRLWSHHTLSSRIVCQEIRGYRAESAAFGFNPKAQQAELVQDSVVVTKDTVPIVSLVKAYREHGHACARVNPLLERKELLRDEPVRLQDFALSEFDSVQEALPKGHPLLSEGTSSVAALKARLDELYCGHMTVEVAHMLDTVEQEWFCREYERISQLNIDEDTKKEAAILMKNSQVFENFVASKFTTVKRYGGDGCQALVPLLNKIFHESVAGGVETVVIGMPHRGRLNLQSTLMQLPPVEMFRKMKGFREWPENIDGCGDVLSHLCNSVTLRYNEGNLYVSMIPNPSHLEAANPVAVGKTRAKQRLANDGDYCSDNDGGLSHKTLCVQVHGDAAFSGQGVLQETLAISGVPHYNVGGSIHVIVNNQLGFTTEAERGRTSAYSSCVSKMNAIPIIRVNGEDPEAVMKAAMVAVSYRNTWAKDVMIDMMCYRRYGHNELDNPSFTQPTMYKVIDAISPLPDRYATDIIAEGVCSKEEVDKAEATWKDYLNKQHDLLETHQPTARHLEKQWSGLVQPSADRSTWDTGVSVDLLRYIAAKSVSIPDDFLVHPTLQKTHIQRRLDRTQENLPFDWATAESLAFGSVLSQGYDVRISGQDVGRGTFSHRHVMLVDQETDAMYVPLNHMYESQSNFLEVCNSILSEEAVLGFEYGFSIESPKCLTIWEAQFGDFFNGAQIMIDTYIASGEAKWLKQSGLVMLLPTGMDGAGPEHSSCRLERFLQLTDSAESQVDGDSVNMAVAYPTTPAQYFHLLRRQMVRNFRKPLIMAAPKVLLRHPAAVSEMNDLAPGTTFHPVLDDATADNKKVSKLLFCSGQHYYSLFNEKERRGLNDTAIIRIEELCPFPAAALQSVVSQYKAATQFVWAQEEHRNYGGWTFVKPRFENLIGVKLQYAGRSELCTPATGVGQIHRSECKDILETAFSC
ncbi:2-oxoadipate dehydrogenase complex component E1-like [Watersipora subatra]|uniref:2-oxoadipate dehydrogenase complex component E1-like n=1 Tax=Watersipora subatra TaxID=2589382 RepID=UPI00355B39B0